MNRLQALRRPLLTLALAVLSGSHYVAVASAALIIDDFSVGPITVSRTGATVATATQTGLDPANVLGGSRAITVGEFGAAVQTLTIDHVLRELRGSAPNSPGYFNIKYGSTASPLNLDLTATGNRAFLLKSPNELLHLGSLPTIRLYSSFGEGFASANPSGVTRTPLPGGGTAIRIPFSLIFSSSGGAFDQRHIVSLDLDYGRSGEARLWSASIVPEPATLPLLIVGSMALIAAQCRPKA